MRIFYNFIFVLLILIEPALAIDKFVITETLPERTKTIEAPIETPKEIPVKQKHKITAYAPTWCKFCPLAEEKFGNGDKDVYIEWVHTDAPFTPAVGYPLFYDEVGLQATLTYKHDLKDLKRLFKIEDTTDVVESFLPPIKIKTLPKSYFSFTNYIEDGQLTVVDFEQDGLKIERSTTTIKTTLNNLDKSKTKEYTFSKPPVFSYGPFSQKLVKIIQTPNRIEGEFENGLLTIPNLYIELE